MKLPCHTCHSSGVSPVGGRCPICKGYKFFVLTEAQAYYAAELLHLVTSKTEAADVALKHGVAKVTLLDLRRQLKRPVRRKPRMRLQWNKSTYNAICGKIEAGKESVVTRPYVVWTMVTPIVPGMPMITISEQTLVRRGLYVRLPETSGRSVYCCNLDFPERYKATRHKETAEEWMSLVSQHLGEIYENAIYYV